MKHFGWVASLVVVSAAVVSARPAAQTVTIAGDLMKDWKAKKETRSEERRVGKECRL